MITPKSDTGKKDPARQRDLLTAARAFLMMYNGSLLYGCAHPNTARNAAAFCELINGAAGIGGMVTFISANGTFIVEDEVLDASFNTKKLLAHFEKLGVASLSFERGVSAESVIKLVGLTGDVSNVEMCRAGLEEVKRTGSIAGVRVNYVVYGKIKADEVIINERDILADAPARAAGAGTPMSHIPTGGLSAASVKQLEEVLTLSALLEKPSEISDLLAVTDTSKLKEGALRGAFSNLKNDIDKTNPQNIDDLLESILCLKQNLSEAIQVQQMTGKIMRSAEVINDELNDLTCRAVVKLVREEYRSGKTPLNRLAHTIRRMLPGKTDLMRVLPRMKEMLLADGMALGDYLELVKTLGVSVESESLSEALSGAANSVGASVGDLAAAIKSAPEEAARLILLAAEVNSGAGAADAAKLADTLINYIEGVCPKTPAGASDGKALAKVLTQLESQMNGSLKRPSMSEEVMRNIKARLSDRFGGGAVTPIPVTPAVKPIPVVTRTAGGKMKLPPEALNTGNLLFLMNKEIKRNLRYKTPFSTVMISIARAVSQDGHAQTPNAHGAAELLPQLFTYVQPLLRDVDMIGILDHETTPELFIMLPMTGEQGAAMVKSKIVKKASKSVFALNGAKVCLDTKVSIAVPTESTKTLKTYMAAAKRNHARG